MKEKLLQMISEEDKKHPLTDEELAQRLGVLRETVTLLRGEGNIPDSRERRRAAILPRLRQLLLEEPALSDRALARRLDEEGFSVGKYTVGKLREELSKAPAGKPSTEKAPAERPSEEKSPSQKEKGPDASVFSSFIGYDGSLKTQISRAQAAVLYPPMGLHCLIYGPSGAGKSYLAELMHSFACGTENFGEHPPYYAFNCADYADNPQLLMAQLFGYRKGSFTGADKDKKGVVEFCDGGILFLDEVHRLPPEGQELLFYLMDKGKFRRLGEVENQRESHLMVIAATTENPQSSLLITFRRRIPMTIELPSLRERPAKERLEFIHLFFWMEAHKLGRDFLVKREVLQCLMQAEYAGNVGQVRSDIQVCCAKAFLESKRSRAGVIEILFDCLPEAFKRGQASANSPDKGLRLIKSDLYLSHEKQPQTGEHALLKGWDIYGKLEQDYNQLLSAGLSEEEIRARLSSEVENQLSRNIRQIELSRFSADEMVSIVGEQMMSLASDIYELALSLLPGLKRELVFPLAIHMKMSLQRSAQGARALPTGIDTFRDIYHEEYQAAEQVYKKVCAKYYLTIQEEEISFLAMYFSRFRHGQKERERISVLVVSHGAVACGMAEVANAVMGTDHAKGLELGLMDTPAQMGEKVLQAAAALNRGRGIIILADMGSLMETGSLVWERLGIPVGIVGRTDTMMVIDAVRRTLWTDDSIEQIVEALDVKRLPSAAQSPNRRKRPAILCLCITGEGAAAVLRAFIEERLKSSLHQVEIVTRGFIETSDIHQIIRQAEEDYEFLAIVGTIDPEYSGVPFLPASLLYTSDGLGQLRKILKRRQLLEENDLNQVIFPSHIYIKEGHNYKDNILDEMIGALAGDGFVTPDFLLSVYKRESMMTTVLKGGIAIPHGSPEYVTKPVISVTKLDTPTAWDGINAVDLIFVLALDENSKKYFEQLYQIISDESMIQSIRKCKNPEEIMEILCKTTKPVN